MTLKEAGELYNRQVKKIGELEDTLRILNDVCGGTDETNSFTTCIINREVLRRAVVHLAEHYDHLKYVLDKELC